jgi:hypothetical protein
VYVLILMVCAFAITIGALYYVLWRASEPVVRDDYCSVCGTGPFPEVIVEKRDSGEMERCPYCGEIW